MGLLTIIANYSITTVKKIFISDDERKCIFIRFYQNYAFMSIIYYLMQKICMTTYQNVFKKKEVVNRYTALFL